MLKAFIVIVLAGLGNMTGALYAALLIGMVEAAVKVLLADKWGFLAMLSGGGRRTDLAPCRLFGKTQIARQ